MWRLPQPGITERLFPECRFAGCSQLPLPVVLRYMRLGPRLADLCRGTFPPAAECGHRVRRSHQRPDRCRAGTSPDGHHRVGGSELTRRVPIGAAKNLVNAPTSPSPIPITEHRQGLDQHRAVAAPAVDGDEPVLCRCRELLEFGQCQGGYRFPIRGYRLSPNDLLQRVQFRQLSARGPICRPEAEV